MMGRTAREIHANGFSGAVAARRGVVLAAGVLLVMLMGPAAGAEETDDGCREECVEARKLCHQGAKAAYRACGSQCRETIRGAVIRARNICVEDHLGAAACASLVEKAVAGATRACHADCRLEQMFRRTVCRNERRECRQTCLAPLDPECRIACGETFGECRDQVGACARECRGVAREGYTECRELASASCDPEALRECLDEVRNDLRMCSDDCHDEHSCGADLRECLGECPQGDE
jgi:hypothetical protein